jgi:hypothetical protein
MVDKTAMGQAFAEYFGSRCHSFLRLLHAQSSYAVRGWYNRRNSDRSNNCIPSHPSPGNSKENHYFRASSGKQTSAENARVARKRRKKKP